jgi:hypothetical protein
MVARAAADGFGPAQRAVVDAMQRVVLGTNAVLDDEASLGPQELAPLVTDRDQALQLIRLMVVVCLSNGPPSREQVALVTAFAAALNVDEPAVEVIGHLAHRRLLRFRLAFLRRSHLRHYFRNTYRMAGGLLPVVAAVLRFRGVLGEDPATVSRFKALEALPKETLGYRFFRHCSTAGIPFPGAKGGFPEGAIYHDVTHVLTGYDTSAQGELKNAAFQAGYTRAGHDYFTWLIAMVLHGARTNLTPFPMPNIESLLAEPGLAEGMLEELERGAAVTVDLGEAWDFWDFAELPIDAVRAQLGIRPRLEHAA